MIKVGLIGYGNWGPNIARYLTPSFGIQLEAIAEICNDKRKQISVDYPLVRVYDDALILINDNQIEAVCIATEAISHYNLVKTALLAGKHVMVEKPMTTSLIEAIELKALARKQHLILMVDHILLYTDAYSTLKKVIQQNDLGKLSSYDAKRANQSLFKTDVNVVRDLAYHDVSLLLSLISEKPDKVRVQGNKCHDNEKEHTATLTLTYHSGFTSTIYCSWNASLKERITKIKGSSNTLVYNEINSDLSIEFNSETSVFDTSLFAIKNNNALHFVINEFSQAIDNLECMEDNLTLALDVICVLEAADQSVNNNGEEVQIRWKHQSK